MRRLLWQPPADPGVESVGAVLREYGARPWQIGLTATILATAIAEHPS